MHREEQDKNDELKQLKQDYEFQVSEMQRQINQGTSGNPQVVSDDQQQKWN